MTDQIQDWMDWTTGLTGATEGDLILSQAEIEAIVDGVMSNLGTFHTDPDTLPSTATARPRGTFNDPHDLKAYLDDGGLLTYDELGNPVPNPIVNILKTTIPDRAEPIYEVWIDDETP